MHRAEQFSGGKVTDIPTTLVFHADHASKVVLWYLRPGPGTPLWRAGVAVAHLNLSGRAHWAERMQHGFLLLEGLLLHALYLPALLAPGTGLAAYTPFTWQPTFRETQNYSLWSQSSVVPLLKTNCPGKAPGLSDNPSGQAPLAVLWWRLSYTSIGGGSWKETYFISTRFWQKYILVSDMERNMFSFLSKI